MSKNLTVHELIELMKHWDVEFLCETLNLTPEDILERFEDRVDERYDECLAEVEIFDEEDDDDEELQSPEIH